MPFDTVLDSSPGGQRQQGWCKGRRGNVRGRDGIVYRQVLEIGNGEFLIGGGDWRGKQWRCFRVTFRNGKTR